MQTSQLRHTLHCNYTGVALGVLDLTMTAGHVPYMSHWNEMVCHHALFSLGQYHLCKHMTREWERLSFLIANEEATEHETLNLQIGFVALLHSLESISRDRGVIGLPSILTVQTNLKSLIGLCYWQNYLASKKFSFPELHISKLNDNAALESIKDYLRCCWEQKERYEKNIDDVMELERSKVAQRAILAIRENWIKPAGKKLLWQYCLGYLQGQWAADAQGWMRTLFLGTSNNAINFDYDEIELMEDIIFSNVPGDNAVVNHSVRERINQIKQDWKNHYDAFQIEENEQEFIEGLKIEQAATPEPLLSEFPNKVMYLVARAKWQLANPPATIAVQNKAIQEARERLDKMNMDEGEYDNGL